jgi:hypothetical protein
VISGCETNEKRDDDALHSSTRRRRHRAGIR